MHDTTNQYSITNVISAECAELVQHTYGKKNELKKISIAV